MDHALRSFIKKFGITGNVHNLYDIALNDVNSYILSIQIQGGRFTSCRVIEDDITPEYCIRHKKTYWWTFEYTFRDSDDVTFTGTLYKIPRLVFNPNVLHEQGYFIIEGIEKYPMIQSTIAKNIFNYTKDECTTKLYGCRSIIRVVMTNNVLYLMANDMPIHIGNINLQANVSRQDIRDMFEGLDQRIVNTYDCLLLASENINNTYSDGVEDMFGSMDTLEMLYIVNYMSYLIVGCSLGILKPTEISHVGNKIYRTYATSIRNVLLRNIKADKIVATRASPIFRKIHDQLAMGINTEIILKYKTGTMNIFGRQYKDMISTVSRRSNIDTISNVRKICIPTTEESKNMEMRQVHTSQYGFICPVETPESSNAGLTMVLSTMTILSQSIDDRLILEQISQWESDDRPTIFAINNRVKITRTKNLFEKLLELKRNIEFSHMSVYYNNIIIINTSTDRLMRPVLVESVDSYKDWDSMYGKILYIDPMEQDTFAYHEISECFIVGISTLSIPFANHNQGARSVFGTSMVKQAIQTYNEESIVERKEGLYTEPPIVTTIVDDVIKQYHNGINMKVLVSSYFGYNQEDAIVMTQSFIDRIGFICEDVKVISVVLNPDDVIIVTPFTNDENYNDGVIKEGVDIVDGTLLMSYMRNICGVYVLYDVPCKRDCKIRKINTYATEMSSKIIYEFVTTQYRKLSLGDKIASRHAQKGIITKIIRDDEIPITKSGFIPDIIINPHYMPSRMTLGQVHESNLALYAYRNNISNIDGTIFSKNFRKYLEYYNNTDVILNPRTKQYSKNPCEYGIVYYYMLTHHSVDKIQHRFYGDNSVFSKQPLGGKSKNGGLRMGEMEIDALLAHGASSTIYTVIKESDMTTANICISCGYILSSSTVCDMCDQHTNTIHVSYALKNIATALLTYGIKLGYFSTI